MTREPATLGGFPCLWTGINLAGLVVALSTEGQLRLYGKPLGEYVDCHWRSRGIVACWAQPDWESGWFPKKAQPEPDSARTRPSDSGIASPPRVSVFFYPRVAPVRCRLGRVRTPRMLTASMILCCSLSQDGTRPLGSSQQRWSRCFTTLKAHWGYSNM